MISYLHEERMARLEKAVPFYLYQPALKARLDKVSSKEIWVSDPLRFNDPLDLRLTIKDLSYRGPFDEEKLRQAIGLLINNNQGVSQHWLYSGSLIKKLQNWIAGECDMQELEQAIRERFEQFGVACYSSVWNSSLMWSHYAVSHAGYCIEYAVNKMELAMNNQGLFASYDVHYSSLLPEVCISEALFSPHQTLGRMLATKSVEWAYEREWRLVHLEKKNTFVKIPHGMKLSALIAGLKADSSLLLKLNKKAEMFGIPVYKIKRNHGYELAMDLL